MSKMLCVMHRKKIPTHVELPIMFSDKVFLIVLFTVRVD